MGAPGAPAVAQQVQAPSVEEATLSLVPYKLPAGMAQFPYPAGYDLTLTFGRSNVGFALDWEDLAPEEERSMAADVLARLESGGRLSGVRQYVENLDLAKSDDQSVVTTYVHNATAFRSPDAARAALNDPSFFVYVYQSDHVTVGTGSGLGEASSSFRIAPDPDATGGYPIFVSGTAWQRGSMVFSLHVNGEDETSVAGTRDEMLAFAGRIDARAMSMAQPATMTTAGGGQRIDPFEQFEIAHRLADRVPPAAQLGDQFEDWGMVPVDNAALLLAIDGAVPPFNDPATAHAQLVETERHIISMVRDIQNKFDPPESISQFPNVTVGVGLYETEATAQAALERPLAALATRLTEENRLGTAQQLRLEEVRPLVTMGEGTRMVTLRHVYPADGSEVTGQSLRWRRDNFELFVTATAETGQDVTEYLRRVASDLDERFKADPLRLP